MGFDPNPFTVGGTSAGIGGRNVKACPGTETVRSEWGARRR